MLQDLRGGMVLFYWGQDNQGKLMEEITLELSLEGGVDLGNTEEENGRWTFQAEPTT